MSIGILPNPLIPPALDAFTAEMQGMTPDDAYDAFIDSDYEAGSGVKIGYTARTTETPAISGDTANSISSSANPDPVDAWHDYVENEVSKVSDTTGGIVSGSTATTFAASIMERVDFTPEAVTPVAIPLDATIVAAAQVLGVSIDAAQLNVETKQKFANSIVQSTGMIYDKAKNMVTAWKDAWGNILFPKGVIDAVSSVIDDEGIGEASSAGDVKYGDYYGYSGGTATITGVKTYPYNSRFSYTSVTSWPVMVILEERGTNDYFIHFYSLRSFSIHHQFWTASGQLAIDRYDSTNYAVGLYYWETYETTISPLSGGNVISSGSMPTFEQIKNALSGPATPAPQGFPEGTSQSLAPNYDAADLTIKGSILDKDGNRIPVTAINIPVNPYNSTGSTIDPTSPTPEDSEGVKNPPIPMPIPDTNVSNPDVPLTDSSVVNSTLINELVESLANTLDPQPGQSTGIIPIPPMPGIIDPTTDPPSVQYPSIIPASGPGFIHVYNPTPAEFVSFGNWLWVTYADATIDKILNNPFDGVIGAHELYATPNVDGSDNIRSAFLTSPVTAGLVRNRYSEIDCGTVIVPEFYGNYLDYSPYSQAYIYLPFIGINEVSIDDIVGHAVNIRYRIDAYSGSCIAMIFVAKNGYQNLCYQFAGSCSVEVPMAGGSQAAIKAGMMQAEAYARAQVASAAISAAQQVSGGIASGTIPGIVSGALGGLGTVAAGMYGANQSVEAARVANKSSVQHSGQFGASHGAMGEKVPFIIIRNPIQVKVVNYNDDYGYPAHKRVIVGGCTGYLRVREVNVISAHATDAEKALIEQMLKNGVYVS